MHTLDVLHHTPGMHRSACGFHSPLHGGSAFGWSYDQLGWEMALDGIATQNEDVSEVPK
jgi:glycerol 2-dehydrogenase (NADP+)